MPKKIKKIIPILITVLVIGVAVSLYYSGTIFPKKNLQSENNELSLKEAKEKVMNFINQNILRGEMTATLLEATEESGLYKIKFSVGNQEFESYLTQDGNLFFPEAIDLRKVKPVAVEESKTIGDFSVSKDEICKENGKPLVYFFGSKGCPHCRWEHPIVEEVVKNFEEEISFHNNMDKQEDMDIFQKYSTGGIPTLVLGCKYYRVGSGESAGKEEERKNLTAILCKITDNKPNEICRGVEDLVKKID